MESYLRRRVYYEAGFTLLELLVVLGLIALMAALVVPNLRLASGAGQSRAQLEAAEDWLLTLPAQVVRSGQAVEWEAAPVGLLPDGVQLVLTPAWRIAEDGRMNAVTAELSAEGRVQQRWRLNAEGLARIEP